MRCAGKAAGQAAPTTHWSTQPGPWGPSVTASDSSGEPVRDRDALRRIIRKTPPFPTRLPLFIVAARIDLAAAKEGGRDGGVRVRRPKRGKIRYPNKPKSLDKLASQEDLERAAAAARYVPSDYHCPAKGRSRKHRAKPTMPCPREWTIPEAVIAIRRAILARHMDRWLSAAPMAPRRRRVVRSTNT
jgi:hypothetical protein